MGLLGPLLVTASRQFGKAVLVEDYSNNCRAEWFTIVGQRTADVVDREILFPQRDDPFPKPFLLAWRPTRACGRDEEVARGLMAKLMNKDAKASGRVPEASGRFGRGNTVDEEGPQGFVLPMGGVGWLQEPACQRQAVSRIIVHVARASS